MLRLITFCLLFITTAFAQEKVTLSAKQALILEGVTTQEKMESEFKRGFADLDITAKGLGLTVNGAQMARFPTDTGAEFTYHLYLPIDKDISLTHPKIKLGKTPAGAFYKFIHEGAYDLIDQTYEDMADWLDEKKLTANTHILEEYPKDFRTTNENDLVVNLLIQAQ